MGTPFAVDSSTECLNCQDEQHVTHNWPYDYKYHWCFKTDCPLKKEIEKAKDAEKSK
jgi:hypothetical protein